MKNNADPIKAAPTATIKGSPTPVSSGELSGRKNILTDTLHEMGYDDTFVDILIERNVIDFDTVSYTSHIMHELIEHYGESVLCGGLEEAIVFEGLDVSLIGELGRSWHSSKGSTFRERVRDMINAPIESLGLKVIDISDLEDHKLTPQLDAVKRNVVIDYGEFGMHLPHADIVVYSPENSRVIAVISCGVNLKNRVIDMAYWKLKLRAAKNTVSIKYYLITTDLKGQSLVETDLDCRYILTQKNIEETDKIKLFEHFIEDLKRVI